MHFHSLPRGILSFGVPHSVLLCSHAYRILPPSVTVGCCCCYLIFLAPHILFWKQVQDITDLTGLLGEPNGVSYLSANSLRVSAVHLCPPLSQVVCLILYRIVRTRDNCCHPPCKPQGSPQISSVVNATIFTD